MAHPTGVMEAAGNAAEMLLGTATEIYRPKPERASSWGTSWGTYLRARNLRMRLWQHWGRKRRVTYRNSFRYLTYRWFLACGHGRTVPHVRPVWPGLSTRWQPVGGRIG